MAKKETKLYARYTREAVKLMGSYIKATRIARAVTAQGMAERADISRGLLRRIENGDPTCGIGVVFEVATILGIQLFESNGDDLVLKNKAMEDKLVLLPSRVKKMKIEMDNDF